MEKECKQINYKFVADHLCYVTRR